jgi:hypothetical protein
MKPIAIWYHTLFQIDDKILEAAMEIVHEQMELLKNSGLLEAATEMWVGVNGGPESKHYVEGLIPKKAKVIYHGLQCRNECRTIAELEKWAPSSPDDYVLYFHSKGATHPPGDAFRGRWRNCMMRHLVRNWRQCVTDLDAGYEAVGCHWMEPPRTPDTQFIFAGNFWWARSSFLKTLPSIFQRERIKTSGIDSLESRYEPEVWLGNGPRPPKIKDYHGPGWTPGQVSNCQP